MGKMVKIVLLVWIIGCAGCHQPLPPELENQPPDVPINIFPPDDSTDIMIDITFQWQASDPNENDPLTYDVFLQKDSLDIIVIASDIDTNAFHYSNLQYNARYHWKVTAKDSRGGTATSPTWSFLTRFENNAPPYTPSNPTPANGEASQPIENVTLSWIGGDPDNYSIVEYDIYFGKSAGSMELLFAGLSDTFFVVGILDFESPYYWKIVAKDHYGLITEGPLWQFTTEAAVLLFEENFDSYPVGGYPDAAVWIPYKYGASDLFISDSIAWNDAGNSVQFVDSTAGGNSFLATRLDARVVGKLQFYCRISLSSDVFGLRMYSEIAVENHVGPQLSIRDGELAYYANDFNWQAVCPIDTNTWYSIEILFDCQNQSYNIFVDNDLKAENATWIGTAVTNLDLLYFLTFNNRTCAGAFLDEVKYYSGSGMKKEAILP